MNACPFCGSSLIRTTDPKNEPVDLFKCVDCLRYFDKKSAVAK